MTTTLAQMQPLLYPPISSNSLSWLSFAFVVAALCIIVGIIILTRKHTKPLAQSTTTEQFRQQALLELANIARPSADELAGPWLQQINQLLKRLCSVRYPEYDSHRLTGREWLAFLDSRCPAAGLTRWMILAEGSYQPECRLDEQAIDALYSAIQIWINKHV